MPIKDEEELKHFSREVTKKFFTIGMKPHPYWRPAINWYENNRQRLFDEGMSFKQIANETMRIAYMQIMNQNLVFKGNLTKSAKVEEIDPRIVKDGKEYRDYNDDEWNALYQKSAWG